MWIEVGINPVLSISSRVLTSINKISGRLGKFLISQQVATPCDCTFNKFNENVMKNIARNFILKNVKEILLLLVFNVPRKRSVDIKIILWLFYNLKLFYTKNSLIFECSRYAFLLSFIQGIFSRSHHSNQLPL